MSTSILNKSRAKDISFDPDNMWIEFTDGRKLSVPLVYFPRLSKASDAQRKSFIISGGGAGLHWDDLDEDISVENLLLGIYDRATSANWDTHNITA